MPRSPTTLDPFSAIGEPKRRQVLGALVGGERPVNDLVGLLGWSQPQVSKHLGVLRDVGLVSVRCMGRQRLYKIEADRLKPIHEWIMTFEKFWDHHLTAIQKRAEAKARRLETDKPLPRQNRPET